MRAGYGGRRTGETSEGAGEDTMNERGNTNEWIGDSTLGDRCAEL